MFLLALIHDGRGNGKLELYASSSFVPLPRLRSLLNFVV